jgi:hypothetical protein
MNRPKALYRSWGIRSVGSGVCAPRYRSTWVDKIAEAGVRRRAKSFYQQLDALQVCADGHDTISWSKAGNIAPRSYFARFPASVPSALLY